MKKMSKELRKIVAPFFLFTVLIGLSIMLIFNLTISLYLNNGANKALNKQKEIAITIEDALIESDGVNVISFGNIAPMNENKIFSINNIPLNKEIINNDKYPLAFLFNEDGKQLVEYIYQKDLQDKTNEVFHVSLENNEFYFMIINQKSFQILNEEEIMFDSYVINYINVASIKEIVNWSNLIFTGVLLIFALVSLYLGIKIGLRIIAEKVNLKTFFENASHELKTPLMAIQGYAEGISSNLVNKDEAAEIIIDESDKMRDLIDDILSLSKLDNETAYTYDEEINLKEIIFNIIEDLQPAAQNENIDLLAKNVDDDLFLQGNSFQLYRALTNIVTNGLRYAQTKIEIQAFWLSKNKIKIIITDDGKGISAEDLPHIFERFYSGKQGKTGIGLALTKEIIKHHQGEITAESNSLGAMFIIVLNVKRKIAK